MQKKIDTLQFSHNTLRLHKMFLADENDDLETENMVLERKIMSLEVALYNYQKIVDIINKN